LETAKLLFNLRNQGIRESLDLKKVSMAGKLFLGEMEKNTYSN